MDIVILGIDMAAESFKVELSCQDRTIRGTFKNDLNEFEVLSEWLSKNAAGGPVLACMEATGRYGDALAAYLFASGHKVVVANPKRVRRFAEALGILGKSDKVDAHAVTEYAKLYFQKCKLWRPKTQAEQELRDLRCHIRGLEKAKHAFENRLSSGIESSLVVSRSEHLIEELDREIELAKKRAAEIIAEDARLAADKATLKSQIGFGEACSTALVTYIDFRTFKFGRHVARFVGFTPKNQSSGTSLNRRGHISKEGPGDLRGLLWNAARAAIKNDPRMAEYAARLRAAGKSTDTIRCAVARKMLVIAHALITKGTLYDYQYSA
jgi:transposase